MMRRSVKFAFYLLIAGSLLSSCMLPTWLVSEITDLVYPSPPASTETAQPLPSETVQPSATPSGKPEPIWVIDRTVFEEAMEPRYKINGVWPNLVGPEDTVATFNNESDRLSQQICDDFLTGVNDRAIGVEGSGEAPISTLIYNYTTTYSDENIFSFYLDFDQYIALSAHPFPFSVGLNYDAQQSDFIQLGDLFLVDVDYIEKLEAYVDTDLTDRGFGYEVGTAGEVMRERENWNMLPEGLRINFDVYEVAPYAAGPQYILISWVELSEILDPNSPAGAFLD